MPLKIINICLIHVTLSKVWKIFFSLDFKTWFEINHCVFVDLDPDPLTINADPHHCIKPKKYDSKIFYPVFDAIFYFSPSSLSF